MAESREFLFNGLRQYSADDNRIGLILLEMGEDPEAGEFPEGTLSKAEAIFQRFGQAATKVIESGSVEDTQLAVQQTSAISAELLLEQHGISFAPDVVLLFAQSALEEGTQLAHDLTNLKETALIAGLRKGNQQLTEKLIQSVANGNSIINEVFSEENVQAMVNAATPQIAQVDIKGFLSSLDDRREQRRQSESKREQQRAALPPVKVDVKAFLAGRP